ncbi:MAG: protein kinase [Clostridia bacterium]|nr:protein kinase [Clostridia bacterium]
MSRCYHCFQTVPDGTRFCPHCGQEIKTTANEPIQLVPGTVLAGRYLIGESVGSGGFGIVYRAWDMKLEAIVAVKEFFISRLMTRAAGQKQVILSRKVQTEFEYRKDRFLAEARTMAKFGNHRSIPNVFEFFEENGTAYIVMELLQGVALNDYLRQNGGVVEQDLAIMIANEVGTALKSLHAAGIIHRDVAPDNIFICSGQEIRIKLMDLGAARLADTTDDVIDIILKPGYSPVEQYDNSKNIGPWTDIYALGATLYAMLTGVKPEESTNRKIKDTVVPPHELNPYVTENLSNAVMKAMAIERHLRFKSVDEFLDAINGERKVIPLAKEKKRRSARRFTGIALAAVFLVAVGLLVSRLFYKEYEENALDAASISVWFSVAEGSTEEAAMQSIKNDFEDKFPDVKITLQAIPEAEYADALRSAAEKNEMPNLFESTDAPISAMKSARDLTHLMTTPQAKECLFLNNYKRAYPDGKKIPLAIEIPVAYVITSGNTQIDYSESYFRGPGDFGDVGIAAQKNAEKLLEANFGAGQYEKPETFLDNYANTSPVMLGTTMMMNEFRSTLTNYAKACVYPNGSKIVCRYTYEWSIGKGSKEEQAAAERLLAWMMGNVYQTTLMITECNDGQIPINETCFLKKLETRNLQPIKKIYKKFVFE